MSALDAEIVQRARSMQLLATAKKLVFIGNSLTFWNKGVDQIVAKLAPGAECSTHCVGGATLESLWNTEQAQAAIAGADVVVLQEDLPESTPESFERYAALWIAHCFERRRR